MKKNEFKFRKGNLELRSCDKHLLSNAEHTTAEIVKWYSKENCITIASWVKSSEGYDIQFIKDRPFEENINWSDFKMLLQNGQSFLTHQFEAEHGD